jgi:DNA-binding NarL/FixJ family response regulator
VESEVDRGSTFRVFLPAAPAPPGAAPPDLRGKGLLAVLADPDPADLAAAKAALLAEGFAVLEAGTLDGARALASRHRPAAVLLDARLAGGAAPGPFEAPWIALLAVKDSAAVDRAMQAGAAGCLLKPLRPDDLFFLLGRAAGTEL